MRPRPKKPHRNKPNEKEMFVLIEGPQWGDASFFGKWFLAAAEADRLHLEAYREDAKYRVTIKGLESIVDCLSFGWMAVHLVKELGRKYVTLCISTTSEEAEYVAMMAQMGFFVRTGDRYQITVPHGLTIQKVKDATCALAGTEDTEVNEYMLHDYMLHPEELLACVSEAEAAQWERALRVMDPDQRLAERTKLLASSETPHAPLSADRLIK
jgi:hypothetical protein